MNPYKILNINKSVEKRDIILAVTAALKQKKYTARQIADAQKQLMDPLSKGFFDFICFMDTRSFMGRPKPLSFEKPAQNLEYHPLPENGS